MRISGDHVVEIEFVRGRSSIGSANTCRVAMIENTAVMISEGRIIGTLMRVAIWISVHPSSVAASYSSLGTDFSEVYSTTMLNPEIGRASCRESLLLRCGAVELDGMS